MKRQTPQSSSALLVSIETIRRRIFLIRGSKVMLDSDLAALYQVPTFRLNEAVKRNKDRFPEDFMFQLTRAEGRFLTSQSAMSKVGRGRGGRRTLPYAFTEHGVAMLSSVLNSERAVQMNILIIRAFVKLRELVASHIGCPNRKDRSHSRPSRLSDQHFGRRDQTAQTPRAGPTQKTHRF
jgi:ORF6N domain